MLLAAITVLPDQELVSLATTKMSAAAVTRESGWVRQEHLETKMTLTRVETRLLITRQQTMAIKHIKAMGYILVQ